MPRMGVYCLRKLKPNLRDCCNTHTAVLPWSKVPAHRVAPHPDSCYTVPPWEPNKSRSCKAESSCTHRQWSSGSLETRYTWKATRQREWVVLVPETLGNRWATIPTITRFANQLSNPAHLSASLKVNRWNCPPSWGLSKQLGGSTYWLKFLGCS